MRESAFRLEIMPGMCPLSPTRISLLAIHAGALESTLLHLSLTAAGLNAPRTGHWLEVEDLRQRESCPELSCALAFSL